MAGMSVLTTNRLVLAPLSFALIRARLAADNFAFEIAEVGTVHFGPTWPGDAVGMFSAFLASGVDPVPLSFVAIDRERLAAVGQLGATTEPSDDGEVEIGYGFGLEGRGYATEAVAALVAHLLDSASISAVTANTAVDNRGSQRVLEKNGFAQVGASWSEDDGDLLVWRRV
jgi:ribosomal-protein-alanine N-acetyltransferase